MSNKKYNSFIDDYIIDSCINIRREYLILIDQYNQHSKSLSDMTETMLKICNDLESYKDTNLKKEKNIEDIQKFIFEKLSEIEKEYNIVKSKIDPINDNIEKLRKDEDVIFETLKSKYSNKSDKEIVLEVSKFVDK